MSDGIGAMKRAKERGDRAAVFTDLVPVEAPDEQAALRKARGLSGPENDALGAMGVSAEHTFELDYTDRRGHHWRGRFRCHVLTADESVQVSLTKAQMLNGTAPYLLDDSTLLLLEARAHLAVALDEAPAWAKRLGKLRDHNVIAAIYKEVVDHERRFHGAASEDAGTEAGG